LTTSGIFIVGLVSGVAVVLLVLAGTWIAGMIETIRYLLDDDR
jgi:hypothetical protein